MEAIQSPEIERKIGICEHQFDLAKTRVEQLELSLKNSEGAIERNQFISADRAWRQLKRIETALNDAREALDQARSKVEEAWGWRSKMPSNSSPSDI
jgi:DNA repair exonuclease SbcCD ATPase subunit